MDIVALIIKDSSLKSEALIKLHGLQASVTASLFGGQYQPDVAEREHFDWVQSMAKKITGSREEVEKIFLAAEKTIRAVEPVVLFLPFELPAEETAAISRKIKSLLEIKIDPSLLAGCALSYNGVYKDYSLKAKLQEKHKEIINIVQETKMPIPISNTTKSQ